jgi:hypothetical protein
MSAPAGYEPYTAACSLNHALRQVVSGFAILSLQIEHAMFNLQGCWNAVLLKP